MSFETQINSIINDAKQKGINFKNIVTENALKIMIDFNKELEFARLADKFIEAFKQKTGITGENDISMENLSNFLNSDVVGEGLVKSCFNYTIDGIEFDVFREFNTQVTLQNIINQSADFITLTIYYYKEDATLDEENYIEIKSPDFRFLKKLKNTIYDILRKYKC